MAKKFIATSNFVPDKATLEIKDKENDSGIGAIITTKCDDGYMVDSYNIIEGTSEDTLEVVLKNSIDATFTLKLDDTTKDNYIYVLVSVDGVPFVSVVDNGTIDLPLGSTIKIEAIEKTSYYKVGNIYANGELINNGYEFIASENVAFEVNFRRYYTISTTSLTPKIDVNILGGGEYFKGDSCTLIARVNDKGYELKYWVKDGYNFEENPFTFVVSKDFDIQYYCDYIIYTIKVYCDPKEVGSVYVSQETFTIDDVVTIKARDFNGYTFISWSDGNTDNPRTISGAYSNIILYAQYNEDSTEIEVNWRAYVKDQFNIGSLPKAFLKLMSFEINEDLLTTANSSFECYEVPSNISEGDILCVYNPFGKLRYKGKITSIEDLTIQTSQIVSMFGGQWVYDLPNWQGSGNNKSWLLEKYNYLMKDQEETDYTKFSTSDLPTLDDLIGQTMLSTQTYLDSNTSLSMNLGEKYTMKCTSYVYSDTRVKVNLTYAADNGCVVYVNSKKIGSVIYKSEEEYSDTQEVIFRKGWNKIIVVYTEYTGGDGFLLTIDGNHLSSYFSQMTSLYTEDVGYLEEIFKTALSDYCNGKMRDSTYVDTLVKEKLGQLTFNVTSNTKGGFQTQNDNYTMDMEQMIYDLYSNYNILLDVNIPYNDTPSVNIGKSNVNSLKVGNNIQTITSISPVTEVAETNRLIIYDNDGMYRTTYIAKADGTRVKEPSSTANRFGVVNTSIVYSDDEIKDILEANLPSEMYNHKLTFTLSLLSKIFKYDDFVLGMPLQVWKDSEYFSTVLTGRSYSKEQNQPVTEVNYTCGKVRTSLTKKLLLKLGVLR